MDKTRAPAGGTVFDCVDETDEGNLTGPSMFIDNSARFITNITAIGTLNRKSSRGIFKRVAMMTDPPGHRQSISLNPNIGVPQSSFGKTFKSMQTCTPKMARMMTLGALGKSKISGAIGGESSTIYERIANDWKKDFNKDYFFDGPIIRRGLTKVAHTGPVRHNYRHSADGMMETGRSDKSFPY